MCAAPISGGDEGGWTAADAEWERLQVAAAEALAADDPAGAAASWAAALRIARAEFEADDPRLATSIANHAAALRREGDPVAGRLVAEALRVWGAAPSWLARQRFAARARSSLFHLRLEAKHRGTYEVQLRQRAQALVTEGRDLTQMLAGVNAGEGADLAAWERVRPAGLDAMRKLLAAVHLLARPSSAAGVREP